MSERLTPMLPLPFDETYNITISGRPVVGIYLDRKNYECLKLRDAACVGLTEEFLRQVLAGIRMESFAGGVRYINSLMDLKQQHDTLAAALDQIISDADAEISAGGVLCFDVDAAKQARAKAGAV